MTDQKDNSKQLEATSESSQEDNQQESQKPATSKERLRFKKKDMYEIKFNF